ncbi:MAG TPA: isoleucine--tRNA ligase [Conexibacter sp.]|nr:isoleucine--tRNA ligase [Conexibacter sp.]
MTMEPHRPVEKRPDFPALEERVLAGWREGRVFERSLAARADGPVFSFSEGPPTANGDPGSHHVLLRSFKDLYLRYKTMRGFHAPRKAGWDCHGLPVELSVERELGLNSKREIETYGIEAFNEKCRESNARYIASWERLTERVGFWIDLEHAFRTGDPEYIESVWWSLHELWDKGLIYKGHKVVPYCPRCGTGLSSHETAMGYAETEDLTATVRLPVTEPRGPLRAGDQLLIWTTQPWTLFANCAVAISPSLTYVRARVGDEVLVVAEERMADLLGEEAEVLERFGGRAIVDTRYEPPLDRLPDHGPKGHTVLAADHVVLDKGSGLVHTAMAFGEEDFVLCERHGIPLVNPVREDGTYDERIRGYEGMFVGDATPLVVEELRAAGKLWSAAPYVHSYPHCWRCDSKLLYYAKESWYIATRDQRHAMLAQNQRIDWRPAHVRDGRFGNWLQGNVDWALSRDRYWGTPLPIWECDATGCDARHCIGSLAELREVAGALPEDLHRPFIDDVAWGCTVEGCGGEMRRVKATIDTWYDSAVMPFAQHHYPFEGRREVAEQCPSTFICEGIDQTRGWFYTSLACSTLLFDDIPFQHAICVGHVQDEHGHKMSKSRGNAVDPWEVLNTHGADAFRWYYLASQQPWAGYRFSAEAVETGVRELLMPLWTTYGFYVLYANIERFDEHAAAGAPPLSERPALDRWAISRLQELTLQMRERIDAFDATTAVRLAAKWVEDLSNWYIRLSRRRFWNGEPAALATLRECLVTTAKLLAPAVPFVAEEIYSNLVGGAAGDFGAEPESVHLCDYPEPDGAKVDGRLDADMALVREAIELGRDARGRSKVKVRQPLARAIVCGDERTRDAVGRLRDLVLGELNVKALETVTDVAELERPVVLPNLQRLGPRCGRDLPAIVAALRTRDGEEALRALRDHGVVTVAVATGDELDPTHTYALAENDIIVRSEPRAGLVLSTRGALTVAIDTAVEERLRREGLAREIVRVVQQARREAGVEVTDRIELRLGGSEDLLTAARTHEGYVAEETLATAVVYNGEDARLRSPIDVEGEPLAVEVVKAGTPG